MMTLGDMDSRDEDEEWLERWRQQEEVPGPPRPDRQLRSLRGRGRHHARRQMAKPQTFGTRAGWFTCNLAANLAPEPGLSGRPSQSDFEQIESGMVGRDVNGHRVQPLPRNHPSHPFRQDSETIPARRNLASHLLGIAAYVYDKPMSTIHQPDSNTTEPREMLQRSMQRQCCSSQLRRHNP